MNVRELKPYGNFPAGFSFGDKVRVLERPYTPISGEDNAWLEGHNVDVFTDGTRLYSYGGADGGKALCPVQEAHRGVILPLADVWGSLSRCAFLLYKLMNGDREALCNVPHAVDEAVTLLKQEGKEEEWME